MHEEGGDHASTALRRRYLAGDRVPCIGGGPPRGARHQRGPGRRHQRRLCVPRRGRQLYRFEIDNTGDAVADHRINVVFSAPSGAGVQTFDARFPSGIVVSGDVTPPSAPDDPIIVEDAANDISVFAGPRDDPFFFDAAAFNRFRATGDPDVFDRGINSFADLNVSAIVLAFPDSLVSDGESQLQISGFTFERRRETFGKRGRSLDRMGNPAVNTVFIPFALKDDFNRGEPKTDARDFGQVIADSLEMLGTSDENIATLAAVAIPDTLKFDLDADDGFPNGRALEDDVIDTLFSLIFNGDPPTTDNVANDSEFLDEFPFLAPPVQPE
jgi:Domain of unknown function (DUF4331)